MIRELKEENDRLKKQFGGGDSQPSAGTLSNIDPEAEEKLKKLREEYEANLKAMQDLEKSYDELKKEDELAEEEERKRREEDEKTK